MQGGLASSLRCKVHGGGVPNYTSKLEGLRTRRAPPEAAQPEAGWLRAASGERASGALRMIVEKTRAHEDGHT